MLWKLLKYKHISKRKEDISMNKPLMVYYSRTGENCWNGSIKILIKGNTERAAEMFAGLTGGTLFQIDTEKSYAAD